MLPCRIAASFGATGGMAFRYASGTARARSTSVKLSSWVVHTTTANLASLCEARMTSRGIVAIAAITRRSWAVDCKVKRQQPREAGLHIHHAAKNVQGPQSTKSMGKHSADSTVTSRRQRTTKEVKKANRRAAVAFERRQYFLARLESARVRHDWHEVRKVFGEALTHRDAHTIADVHVFNAAVSAAAASGKWQEALVIMAKMRREGIRPDLSTYNSAIIACRNAAGQSEQVVALLTELQTEGIAPSLRTYSAAMSACRKDGQWKKALMIFGEMRARKDICPDVEVYVEAITAYAVGGQWEKALALLRDMKAEGSDVPPNVVAYTAAIAACGWACEWERAVGLLREMQQQQQKQQRQTGGGSDILAPNVVTYSAAITACGNGGQWAKAVSLLREMQTDSITPDVQAYNAVIFALTPPRRRVTERRVIRDSV